MTHNNNMTNGTEGELMSNNPGNDDKLFDRPAGSRFVPDAPDKYSEQAEEMLEKVYANSLTAAICIRWATETNYYFFIPDTDNLVRLSYRPELDCYKKDEESKDEDHVPGIHRAAATDVPIEIVPKAQIDRHPTRE